MAEQVHPTAAAGFDQAADVYERARPGYPKHAVDATVEALALAPTDVVLDLAAGTGKFTVPLVERGFTCIAVEPVAGMRETFLRVLTGVAIHGGTAEAIPLADESVDAIVAAQAAHWFDMARAVPEMHRVLRPGRALALVWNARDDRVPWVQALTEIIDPYADGSDVGIPRHRDHGWRPALDDLALFTPSSYAEFDHGHPTTPDSLFERVASTSFIAVLDDDQKATVLEQVRVLVEDFDLGEQFDFPYVCQLHAFTRA